MILKEYFASYVYVFSLDISSILETFYKTRAYTSECLQVFLNALFLGHWIVNLGEELSILNHVRVQEVIVFKRLMQNHPLKSNPLPKDPIDIYKESRWNPDFNSTLESLFENDVIEDKRFTLNGIKIKRTSPNG